ncbi:uncharacterized protein K452DRAFT_285022 [Aplosporella prunicola CBS 121167]|uniref:Uncharacterized protein n=1 Tax=Aplosporella prunicola CBS 121167 TaxID=1176127 RepID=A0A6A6BN65_9PEZI|nr:uncharacterized protein K452DRAFT_285022 [Aplosporella prunicola CBS 121167]KAF2144705.1 hypothetical protein K452DRAFT_285022 [Aplosporella prunicola CBS 121167]
MDTSKCNWARLSKHGFWKVYETVAGPVTLILFPCLCIYLFWKRDIGTFFRQAV